MTRPVPGARMRIVPDRLTAEMSVAGDIDNGDFTAMLDAAPNAGTVTLEMLKVGVRAHYNAPEAYEPSVHSIEGLARALRALGLTVAPAADTAREPKEAPDA